VTFRRVLVMLEQARHDSRKRESRPVQSMHETRLPALGRRYRMLPRRA
jgi:hypothetical protein